MTLQELIGELQTLAMAYPDSTPIRVATNDAETDLLTVEVQSHSGGVEIHLKVS